ncbi:WD40 repeat domain-containing protein [Aspergillus undulatus]|uniref:WD40 repeat domain-containing protein n=1 Tax=Aspergillus undulatus TaxID=1810928 RepID=UPI003CCDF424
MGSGGETTENNRLTEEKIRDISKNPNVETDMLDAFLNGIGYQESFEEPSAPASVSNPVSVFDSQSKYEEVVRRNFESDVPDWLSKGPRVEKNWSPELQTLEGHSKAVLSVTFSPSGQLLASGSDDKTIKLWDPSTDILKHTLEGHFDSVQSVAFSPDGWLLASGSNDQTIKLWNPVIGALKHTLEGHSGWVMSVAFSPNGQLLASGSDDQTIKIWDPASGTLHHTLEGHFDSVNVWLW